MIEFGNRVINPEHIVRVRKYKDENRKLKGDLVPIWHIYIDLSSGVTLHWDFDTISDGWIGYEYSKITVAMGETFECGGYDVSLKHVTSVRFKTKKRISTGTHTSVHIGLSNGNSVYALFYNGDGTVAKEEDPELSALKELFGAEIV